MPQFIKMIQSSIGKKIIMALTGLAMVGFLIEHLTGNLLLFTENPEPYNKYAHTILSFGWLIIVAEVILIGVLVSHMFSAISITLGKKKARPVKYVKTGKAGGPSKKTFASSSMIWTGILTFIFIVIHLKTFKFGPDYSTTVDGERMRDLHTLVWGVFQNPIYVFWYVGTLAFLGFHLRHGFWSAFQSLGVNHPKFTPIIYTAALILALAIAVGFIGIPLWIFFRSSI